MLPPLSETCIKHNSLAWSTRTSLALAALSVCNFALAEPLLVPEQPLPHEASTVDRVGVPVMALGACDPVASPDPDRAPEIRLTDLLALGTNL